MLYLCAIGIFSLSGCYTVLMHPSVLTKSEDGDGSTQNTQGDYTASDISYNQNCLSCHSQAELDDRYYDMQSVGMVTAHGLDVDPYGWRNPSAGVPWWYDATAPVPSTAVSKTSSSSASSSGPHTRKTGETRGGDGSPADGTVQASTSSTTTTSPASAPTPSAASAGARDRSGMETSQSPTDRTRTTTTPSAPTPPDDRKRGPNRGDGEN